MFHHRLVWCVGAYDKITRRRNRQNVTTTFRRAVGNDRDQIDFYAALEHNIVGEEYCKLVTPEFDQQCGLLCAVLS